MCGIMPIVTYYVRQKCDHILFMVIDRNYVSHLHTSLPTAAICISNRRLFRFVILHSISFHNHDYRPDAQNKHNDKRQNAYYLRDITPMTIQSYEILTNHTQ